MAIAEHRVTNSLSLDPDDTPNVDMGAGGRAGDVHSAGLDTS